LELKQDIIDYGKKNYRVERELSKNRELIKRLNEIKAKLNELKENVEKVERITGKNNQWHHIFSVFAKSLDQNRLSWISDLTSNDNGFTVEGFTTNRRAVIAFSQLFPESRITNVSKNDNQELTIWKFNISCGYPDPKSWQEVPKEKENPAEEKVEKPVKEEIQKQPKVEEVAESSQEINKKYNEILLLYFDGNIADALAQFTEFVEKYPNHKMAYNAKYFIGECLYLSNQFAEARKILEVVYNLNGSKSPDALIMLGNCSEKENDNKTAIQYWETLIAKYPNNNLAKAARYKIDKIKGN